MADPAAAFSLLKLEDSADGQTLSLIQQAQTLPQVRAWAGELERFLPGDAEPECREYLRLALLGVCAGFAERQLSPYLPAHTAIIPPLLEEVRSVCAQLHALGAAYDPQTFRARAFHYGLHKATTLDWQLYGSKECY